MRNINSVLRCLDWSRTAKAMSPLSKDWTCGISSVFPAVCTVGNSLCRTSVHHSVDELSPLGDLSVARQEVLHTVDEQSLRQLCRDGEAWSICMQHCCSETRARHTENWDSVPPEAETTLFLPLPHDRNGHVEACLRQTRISKPIQSSGNTHTLNRDCPVRFVRFRK